jgi:hypothetical protein
MNVKDARQRLRRECPNRSGSTATAVHRRRHNDKQAGERHYPLGLPVTFTIDAVRRVVKQIGAPLGGASDPAAAGRGEF